MAGNLSYRLVCAAQTFASVIGELQNGSQRVQLNLRGTSIPFSCILLSMLLPLREWLASFVERRSPLTRDQKIRPSGGSQTMLVRCLGRCAVFVYTLPLSSLAEQFLNLFLANEGSQSALIGAANKVAFLKTTWNDVPVFVSSERLIDIDAATTTPNFDVRDHFFSAVPVVSYIRWAFTHSSWNAPRSKCR